MPSTSLDRAAVPWADLPPELCGLVVDRLDAFSVLRFPAVCKSWAAAYREIPRRLRAGGPALLSAGLVGCSYGLKDIPAGTCALQDPSTGGKSFRAEATGLRNRCWVGGKDDWLVTMDWGCGVELLNPVTGEQIRLPSFATIPGSRVEKGFRLRVRAPRTNFYGRFTRVTLCRTPAHRNGYYALALFGSNFLVFTAAGGKCWTRLKNHPEYVTYADVISDKGKIFAVGHYGDVYFWDMGRETEDPAVVRAPVNPLVNNYRMPRRFNLAPSSSDGQLVLVFTYGDRRDTAECTRRIMVYDTEQRSFDARGILLHKLDVGSGAWRRVSDLGGDHALFVGTSHPFYVTVPRGSKDLKANCVYAADISGYEAVVFDLEQGSAAGFEPLVYPCEGRPLQTPVWFAQLPTRLEGI